MCVRPCEHSTLKASASLGSHCPMCGPCIVLYLQSNAATHVVAQVKCPPRAELTRVWQQMPWWEDAQRALPLLVRRLAAGYEHQDGLRHIAHILCQACPLALVHSLSMPYLSSQYVSSVLFKGEEDPWTPGDIAELDRLLEEVRVCVCPTLAARGSKCGIRKTSPPP